MILIISHPEDIHSREVISHLNRMDVPVRVLDLSEFPARAALDLRYGPQGSAFSFRNAHGTEIDLDAVGAVWWRRPQPYSFAAGLQAADYALAECDEAFAGLWQAMRAGWINPPVQDAAASRKSLQLRLAGDLGLDPPLTRVTNCPEAAQAFVAEIGDVIYKPFAATTRHWRETRRFGEAERARIANIRHAPTILQERIEGRDIRVTVIGDEIFAAEIDTSDGNYADDFRMNHNVAIRAIELPPGVIAGIRAMMAALRLVYGAFDFRRAPDGRYRFLEVNPAGQFLFVEYETGQPIARAFARTLRDMAAAHGKAPAITHRNARLSTA